MLRLYLCDYSDAYIVVKGTVTVEGADDKKKIKNYHLKTMLYLDHAHKNL